MNHGQVQHVNAASGAIVAGTGNGVQKDSQRLVASGSTEWVDSEGWGDDTVLSGAPENPEVCEVCT